MIVTVDSGALKRGISKLGALYSAGQKSFECGYYKKEAA